MKRKLIKTCRGTKAETYVKPVRPCENPAIKNGYCGMHQAQVRKQDCKCLHSTPSLQVCANCGGKIRPVKRVPVQLSERDIETVLSVKPRSNQERYFDTDDDPDEPDYYADTFLTKM